MNKPYQNSHLLDFQKRYQTEKDYERRLFGLHWPEGSICPRCGYREYYFIKERKLYQCKQCRHQVSLTSSALMYGSRMPLLFDFGQYIG